MAPTITGSRRAQVSRKLTALLLLGLGAGQSSLAFVPSVPPRASARAPSAPLQLFWDRSEKSSSGGSSTGSSNSVSRHHGDVGEHRRAEFFDLGPAVVPPLRAERLGRDEAIRSQFDRGDELWDLRARMDETASRLVQAMKDGREGEEDLARRALRGFERRDPELVYLLELADMEQAARDGRASEASLHRDRAMAARSCLPQFNLDGLWVGKYGSHGYELINVTYAGDTLVATKVTGDRNVPRGEITFKVDLNPLHQSAPSAKGSREQQNLSPIQLTEKAAKKWGTKKLARYQGTGQVAEEGFRNHQWMEGQLIIIGDAYFSFAWIPIESQIFFGRPSPELALRMLRESGVEPLRALSADAFARPPDLRDDIEVQKRFVLRMLEATHEMEDELSGEGLGCIWQGEATDECYFE